MMKPRTDVIDIVISFDFLPQIGGAHTWLYEVYRRWPSLPIILTSTSENIEEIVNKEREFDAIHGSELRIIRDAFHFDDIHLLKWKCLREFWRSIKRVGLLAGESNVRLHCLRAFPEGFSGMLFQLLHPHRTKLITYAHGEEVLIAESSKQLKCIARWVYSKANVVICNSKNTKHLVTKLAPSCRARVIHPGVDARAFGIDRKDSRLYRSRWGWPSDAVVLCTVSRLELRKNQATVIRALAALRKEGLEIRYVCAGEGPENTALATLVKDLSVEDAVRFCGKVSEQEKRLTYAASDIHVMPAIQVGEMIEGFGIVFLEAAASGLPCICGNNGGQVEAVLGGKTGLVVDGLDLEEVKSAIKILAKDDGLRICMGAAGKAWAEQHDWEKVVQRTRLVVEEFTNQPCPGEGDRRGRTEAM